MECGISPARLAESEFGPKPRPHMSPKSDPFVRPYVEAEIGTRHTKGSVEVGRICVLMGRKPVRCDLRANASDYIADFVYSRELPVCSMVKPHVRPSFYTTFST